MADGAQGVPHFPVDVSGLGVDMLAFSGHKMLGPTGIGVLWARLDLLQELDPPWAGGGQARKLALPPSGGGYRQPSVEWEDPPWKFEPGTPPIIEAIGLSEAVRYLERLGMANVEAHEAALTRELYEALREIPGVRLVGPPPTMHPRTGVVSFTLDGLTPDAVSLYLGARGIAVRSGLHCAHPLHRALGLDEGTVRASLYIYNCLGDVEKLVDALHSLTRISGSP